MDILQILKNTARQIITIASKDDKSKTWDEQPSAPKGGFTDRAGFVLIGKFEAYADVALVGQKNGFLRARIAKVTGEGDDEHFFIITLDFSADAGSVQSVIEKRRNISAEILTAILDQETTTPKLIHVSYNTGHGGKGNSGGKRYEYPDDQVLSLGGQEQAELVKTLKLTFDAVQR